MVVVERLLMYWAEPFTDNRGELHKPGRLNHSSTTWWGDGCSELDWTILRSGHDPDRTTLLQGCGAELDCPGWGRCCSGAGLTRWNLMCPVSLDPVPQRWGAADRSGWGGWYYGAGMVPGGT